MRFIGIVLLLVLMVQLNGEQLFPNYYDKMPDYSRFSIAEIESYNLLASRYNRRQITIAYVALPKKEDNRITGIPELHTIFKQEPRPRQTYRGERIMVYYAVAAGDSKAQYCIVAHPGKYWDFADDQQRFFENGLATRIRSRIDTSRTWDHFSAAADKKDSGYPIASINPEPGSIALKGSTVYIDYIVPFADDGAGVCIPQKENPLCMLKQEISEQRHEIYKLQKSHAALYNSLDDQLRAHLWTLIISGTLAFLLLVSLIKFRTSKAQMLESLKKTPASLRSLKTEIQELHHLTEYVQVSHHKIQQSINTLIETQSCGQLTDATQPDRSFRAQSIQLYHINYELFKGYYDPSFVQPIDDMHFKDASIGLFVKIQDDSEILMFPHKLSLLQQSTYRNEIERFFSTTQTYEGQWVLQPAVLILEDSSYILQKKGVLNAG